ncbi:MAG: CinA family protein [Clostridiales bacterium]|uniref:CinA family protein n=1 Tax=Aminipila sp. TaxID=2060095 RepID=UPI001DB40816|nr:CinA family protein [Clostridiales bacterium]
MNERTGNNSDLDAHLPLLVGKMLIEKNISISCAESCTGGMFAQNLTDIPGISAVFDRGIVTYSNNAKMEELGVQRETLEKYGAVSRQTAVEMAEGVRRVARSKIGVSVTGVAGPGGGTKDKPVGLVYVCAVFEQKILCKELRLNGDRKSNRTVSMLTMFDIIKELIEQEYMKEK